ncbi:MAG TPA: ThuA domain-containing protein, partial [Luteimonas sp.]|nr:ThuA domain-containing protein [Luteimonas sp.]
MSDRVMPMDLVRKLAAMFVSACVLLVVLASCQRDPAKRVVLIGGAASEGPGRHAYPAGIRALQGLLEAAPDTRGRIEVRAYPDGWPADAHAFDGAAAVVLYFDGLDQHPLRDPARRAAFVQLMRRGVGVVALHQASTVSPDDDLGLPRWLGGARIGTFDRTTEWAQLRPMQHPVARGIAPFAYRDEFYPTLRFADAAAGRRTPVLRATLHPQFRDGRALVEDVPETVDVAWAFERSGGGRSVVYTGTHFLAAFDEPGVR